jgi:hypothetical protein
MIRRLLLVVLAMSAAVAPAAAEDSARMKQLRLLCAQLSGDLTDPGGIAAFRRCLTTHDPLGEIKRDNDIGGRVVQAPPDRPEARPPHGFGHDSRKLAAEGIHGFATSDGRLFYGIDKDGQVWRWDVVTKKAAVIEHNTVAVRVVDADHVLTLDKSGNLWRESGEGAGRAAVDREVVQFVAVPPDTVYVLGRDKKLRREHGNARVEIDGEVKAFQPVDTFTVFVLGSDGKLWRENGDARNRATVAQQVDAFQYLPDGDTVYVLAADGTLWRQESGGAAEQTDSDVAAFQAVDPHLVYVLGRDGRLWREPGNRDRAVLVDGPLLVAAGADAFHALDAQHVVVLGADHKLWNETMPAGR